jgi:Uma2 family endonuclease
VPPLPVRRFTVDEYHRLIEEGFFAADERFELLDGLITEKVSRNPPHDTAVNKTRKRLEKLLPAGWTLRVQSAITTADSEPEPGVAVVRGDDERYRRGHPGQADVGLVVEVANTTLADDRRIKLPLYARAGITAVWIVNLIDRKLEVHTEPDPASSSYRRHLELSEQSNASFVLDGKEVDIVAVGDLLD